MSDSSSLVRMYQEQHKLKEQMLELVTNVLDGITDALCEENPEAGRKFLKALAKDPQTDPAEYFGVERKRREPKQADKPIEQKPQKLSELKVAK